MEMYNGDVREQLSSRLVAASGLGIKSKQHLWKLVYLST